MSRNLGPAFFAVPVHEGSVSTWTETSGKNSVCIDGGDAVSKIWIVIQLCCENSHLNLCQGSTCAKVQALLLTMTQVTLTHGKDTVFFGPNKNLLLIKVVGYIDTLAIVTLFPIPALSL